MAEDRQPDAGPRLRRRGAAVQFGAAALAAGLIWWACIALIPPAAAAASLAGRLLFALKCSATAILFTFVLGVEAVAHERFTSAAFDPLAGHVTRRLAINLRFLQHTLEQLVIFLPGLFLLAAWAPPGSVQTVVAASLVWTLSRLVFWIGYHIGPEKRVAGLVGMAQSLLILLYAAARFGFELAGWWGAALPLLLFALAEAVLVRTVTR